MDGWINGESDRLMDEWMDGQMDGWINGESDRLMDEWMDGESNRFMD